MLGIIMMMVFCIILLTYGYAAVFRKDLIWQVREMSARLEGKQSLGKRQRASLDKRGELVGGLSLVLGAVGLVMTIIMLVIFLTGFPTV